MTEHPASCPVLPAYDASPHHRCPWVEAKEALAAFVRMRTEARVLRRQLVALRPHDGSQLDEDMESAMMGLERFIGGRG